MSGAAAAPVRADAVFARVGGVPVCDGKRATIVGTARADVLRGSAGADVIFAGAGGDRIYGLGGGDTICTGAGNDFIDGGAGVDSAFGGAGANVCAGVEHRSGCSVDLHPPRLVAATASGDRLVATFDEPLDASHKPDPRGASVTVNGLAIAVSSAAIAGRTITFDLSRPVYSDDQVSFGWQNEIVTDLSNNLIFNHPATPIQNRSPTAGCNPWFALDTYAVNTTV